MDDVVAVGELGGVKWRWRTEEGFYKEIGITRFSKVSQKDVEEVNEDLGCCCFDVDSWDKKEDTTLK